MIMCVICYNYTHTSLIHYIVLYCNAYMYTGKTTLLDVLSGRKNTGTIKGGMFINKQPKDEHKFRYSIGI